jgi:cytoskeletal protein CcmA (bactofilin family)
MFFILMPECGPTRIVTNYSAFRKRNRSLSFPRVVVATTEKMSRYRPPESPETLSRCPDPAVGSGGLLTRGVSIKGSVNFRNELLIDGEVEGAITSTGILTVGEHARIHGEIRAKSVKVRGSVEGDIFATERCELHAGCTLRGDIEAPRLVVDENVTFFGNAKVATSSSAG